MTYLNIAEAIHAKTKELMALLPAATVEDLVFTESQDIAVALNELTAICMAACVGDSEKAEALEEAYKNDAATDANAIAKFLDAVIELHKKANPSNSTPTPTPSYDPDPLDPGD